MGKPGGLAYKILIWSYERGTLPYDIICVLILAFVFIVPRSCFLQKKFSQPAEPADIQGTANPPGGLSAQSDNPK